METKVLGGFLEARVMGFDFYQMSPKALFCLFYALVVANQVHLFSEHVVAVFI